MNDMGPNWRKWGAGMSPLEACAWAFNHASWFAQYETLGKWWNLMCLMESIKLGE